MHISWVHDLKAFKSLNAEWNQLLERSVSDVPFLRHEYQLAWWSHLGGGEWGSGALWIGVGRGEQDRLLGIAPFFTTTDDLKSRRLMFIGTVEIADYLDLVVSAEYAHMFSHALLAQLSQGGPQGWEALDLYNIPSDSPSVAALQDAAHGLGWTCQVERLQPCPVIELRGTFEDYLASLDKKQRHELRRKIRRAKNHPAEARWRIVREGDDVALETDTFLDLMRHDPHKIDFLTPEMRAQFHAITRAAHEAGWLQLSFLELGGAAAAGLLNFDYGDKLWIYNSGLDPEHLSLSLGWVNLGYVIEWAIERGRHSVDFMRGDEKYKYQLGGVDRHIVHLTITR